MKRFLMMLSILVISLLLTLSVLMLIGSERPLKIVTFLETHSYTFKSELDHFEIEVLTTQKDALYFNENHVVSAKIGAIKSPTFFPIVVESIDVLGTQTYQETKYYVMRIRMRPILQSEGYSVHFKDAELYISYINQEIISIPLGTFSYYYPEVLDSELFIHQIHSIHETIEGIPSSVGLILGIRNRYVEPIDIFAIDFHTPYINSNLTYAKRFEDEVDRFDDLATLLNYPYDLYRSENHHSRILRIEPSESKTFIIPFRYAHQAQPLFRYPIRIHYTINGQDKLKIIEDFLYIKTHKFIFETSHHRIINDFD